MFSSSFSMKTVPSKEEGPKDSSEKKKSNDNYVQGYNYHWEFQLGSPYLPKFSSEEKVDGMD
tara:strand:- start:595 stop:780 length:186 start_codon:yes stop_codon:yes gene_type:complete